MASEAPAVVDQARREPQDLGESEGQQEQVGGPHVVHARDHQACNTCHRNFCELHFSLHLSEAVSATLAYGGCTQLDESRSPKR